MNLVQTLAEKNLTIGQITKIYHGKENCCRCGCGGRYFEKGTKGFSRALNAMQKDNFIPSPKGTDMWSTYGKCVCRGVEFGPNYVDIPYNPDNDKCYCLYFD